MGRGRPPAADAGAPYALIIDSTFADYLPECEVLEPAGIRVERCADTDREGIARLAPGCIALIVNLYPVTATLLESLSSCRIVARYGVGYDSVDVAAAQRLGIWVANVKDYATEDVSDHAVALLFSAIRNIPFRDRRVREGGWMLHRERRSTRSAGKVLGIVGYGAIGRAFHRKLSGVAFSRVLVADPYIDPEIITAAGAEPVRHDELYAASDNISLHLPLNDETKHIIDARALSRMKRDAILVNTSRGGVIDTGALVDVLLERRIGCAALDVHETEPLPDSSPLFGLDNVILTDHCAWYTEESVVELKRKTAENVRTLIETGAPRYPVNHPTERKKS